MIRIAVGVLALPTVSTAKSAKTSCFGAPSARKQMPAPEDAHGIVDLEPTVAIDFRDASLTQRAKDRGNGWFTQCDCSMEEFGHFVRVETHVTQA